MHITNELHLLGWFQWANISHTTTVSVRDTLIMGLGELSAAASIHLRLSFELQQMDHIGIREIVHVCQLGSCKIKAKAIRAAGKYWKTIVFMFIMQSKEMFVVMIRNALLQWWHRLGVSCQCRNWRPTATPITQRGLQIWPSQTSTADSRSPGYWSRSPALSFTTTVHKDPQ